MALTIGELVGYIRADGSDFERNLARSQLRMEGFRLDVNGRLRDIRGRFVRESEVMGRTLADSFDDAERAGTRIVTVYNSVADAQSRTLRARLARIRAHARRVGDDVGRLGGRLGGLFGRIDFGRIAGGLAGVAGAVGGIAAKLGTAVPLAGALLGTLANIAPAAGLGATAVLALVSANAALKIGLSGVGDAITGAFEAKNAEELAEAVKGLSPTARAFVLQLHSMKGQLTDLKLDVQNELFDELDSVFKRTATATLPVLRTSLLNSARSLGNMAASAGLAAAELADRGTLGKALKGASSALAEMEGAPGLIVKAFGQVAAAAAPALTRLTSGVSEAIERMSGDLDDAFASGRMQRAIESAIDLIGELAEVGGNVGSIIASIFRAADTGGGGFLVTLQEITGALAEAFASPEVQAGLSELFKTMGLLAETAAPLLGEALKVIAPILTELGPPVQTLIESLGDALMPIIQELGPVLVAAARALGSLLMAVAPLLPPIGQLISEALPPAIPLLESLNPLFLALGDLLLALLPILVPLLQLTAKLTELMNSGLAFVISNLLAPAVQMIADLLRGDFSGAMDTANRAGQRMIDAVQRNFRGLPGRVWSALSELAGKLRGRMTEAGRQLRDAATQKIADAVAKIRELPGKAQRALGDLNSTLYNAGVRLIAGFISGITSKIGEVRSTLSDLTSSLTSWKGPESVDARILTPAGRSVIAGFQRGISLQTPALRSQLQGLTGALPGMALAGAGGGGGGQAVSLIIRSDGRPRSDWLVAELREHVEIVGRGDVQLALGRSR